MATNNQQQNDAETLRRKKESKCYLQEYKRYKKYLINKNIQPDIMPDGTERWITRANVDDYFDNHVKEDRTDKTCHQSLPALQWYCNYREWIWGEKFTVKNDIVENALHVARTRIRADAEADDPVFPTGAPDPHGGVKDVVPEEDRLKCGEYILKEMEQDWPSMIFNYQWGNNATLRGASIQKMEFCDLNVSRGFGPERSGPHSRCLMLILRRGERHKHRADTDQQVGVWRHRHYLLCAVFGTALLMIHRLKDDDNISFKHLNKKKKNSWWNLRLIADKDLDGLYTRMYRHTGVTAPKLTYDRTSAVQYGGSEGLAPYQIHSLTKHITDKFHRSYQAEADKEACKVYAGFSKEEAYFVPRTLLKLPYTIEEYENFMFGNKLVRWRAESSGPDGDKTICCDKFLNHVIPYLVEVLVTDGIDFIKVCLFLIHVSQLNFSCFSNFLNFVNLGVSYATLLRGTIFNC